MKYRILYLLLVISIQYHGISQILSEKGMPRIDNYTPNEFGNIGKVWGITSDKCGTVYFSSDGGLIEFDGQSWRRYKGSNGFTRSILIAQDSLIYTGSDLDFGVWKRDKWNDLQYTSLYPFKEESFKEGEEFWQVHNLGETIIFVSFYNLYIYKNNQLIKTAAPSKFTGSHKLNGRLYFADQESGILMLDDMNLIPVIPTKQHPELVVKGLYSIDTVLYIITQNNGIFSWSSGLLSRVKNDLSTRLKSSQVFSFEKLGDSYLAFGTIQEGLLITSIEGKLVHHINKQKGLPNNTVLSMHYPGTGRIWLGLDYGVSSINLADNVSYLYDFKGSFGTGQTAYTDGERFYLGTNQGIYTTPWKELDNSRPSYNFELIPSSEGQVWCLFSTGNELLMGHDRGLFSVKGKSINKVFDCPGVWTIVRYMDKIFLGTYNGIYILDKKDGKWTFENKMNEIYGSCNQLIFDDAGLLWINIPNFGIVKAKLNNDLQPERRENYDIKLFEGEYPLLFEKNGSVNIITESSEYSYDSENKQFEKISNTSHGLMAKGQLPGHYFGDSVYIDYRFIPIYNGFALQYLKDAIGKLQTVPCVLLNKLEVFDHDEIERFPIDSIIPYKKNNIILHLAVPSFDEYELFYRSSTDGNWLTTSSTDRITITDLNPGTHTIYIKTKTKSGLEDIEVIEIRVETPWYKGWMMYAVYFFISLIVLYLLNRWKKSSLVKERKILAEKKEKALQEQSLQHQKKLIQFEQDKLQEDNKALKQQLKSKTVELATNAKLHNDKIKIITAIHEKFEALKQNPGKSNIKWTELDQILTHAISEEDKTFEIQIDELHQEYFHKLKEKFPALSQNDLRMCAYLKIGLNTKEIADLLNVQPSSAYISRSRLRKKLDLQVDEDLYDFLNNI